jgi:hypothetical protein
LSGTHSEILSPTIYIYIIDDTQFSFFAHANNNNNKKKVVNIRLEFSAFLGFKSQNPSNYSNYCIMLLIRAKFYAALGSKTKKITDADQNLYQLLQARKLLP